MGANLGWERRDWTLIILAAILLTTFAWIVNYNIVAARLADINTHSTEQRARAFQYYLSLFTFGEGFVGVLFGIICMIGRGGANIFTIKTIIHQHIAKILYKTETPNPSKVMQQDVWQDTTSVRIGFAFMLAGVILLGTYFLTLA